MFQMTSRVCAAALAAVGTVAVATPETSCTDGIPTIVHGTLNFVPVEGGCWQFIDDAGFPYEPIGGPPDFFTDGATGTVVGCTRADLASFCQVGSILEVQQFHADDDESAACAADLNSSGDVNVDDLLMVIQHWGGPGGDADSNGVTDVGDLIRVILDWGPCG